MTLFLASTGSIAEKVLELLLEHLPPAEELVLDRTQRHPLEPGDLLVGKLAEVAQQDQLPVLPGQALDRLLDRASPLPVAQLAVGSALGGGQVPVAAFALVVLLPQRHHLEAPPPDLVDRRVLRHPEEPGGELVLRVVPIQNLIHLDEDLLRQVVRVVRVAQQAEEIVDETALVTVDQVAEAFPISREDRRNQFLVGRLLRSPRHGWIRKLPAKVSELPTMTRARTWSSQPRPGSIGGGPSAEAWRRRWRSCPPGWREPLAPCR